MTSARSDFDEGRRRLLVGVAAGASLAALGSTAIGYRVTRAFDLGTVGDFSPSDSVGLDREPAARSSPPTTPGPLSVRSVSPGAVLLTWEPAYDDVEVVAHRVERDGIFHDEIPGDVVVYADTRCHPGVRHTYMLYALDADGNETAVPEGVAATVPDAVFVDDLDGDLDDWTLLGLVPQRTVVRSGSTALEGSTTNGRTAAKRELRPSRRRVTVQIHVRYDDKDARSLTLLKLRAPTDTPICGAFVSPAGRIALRNDVSDENTVSEVRIPPGEWHAVALSASIDGPRSRVTMLFDGLPVPGITNLAQDLGTAAVGMLQLGELGPEKEYKLFVDRPAAWE